MRKIIAIALLAGAVLVSACSAPTTGAPSPATTTGAPTMPSPQPTFQLINAQQAKDLMDQSSGYVIVDVRTQAEYQGGHVAGAILIPVDQIAQMAPTALPNKDQMIFVYCRSGVRAATASLTLAQMGYTNVYDFGGITGWPYGTVTD